MSAQIGEWLVFNTIVLNVSTKLQDVAKQYPGPIAEKTTFYG